MNFRLSDILNRRTIKHKIAWFTSLLVGVVLVSQFQMIWYGLQQLKGQVNILANTTPIADLMADEGFPDSLKQKLNFIEEVKQFTTQELGFDPVNTYTDLFNQDGKPILWVLTAAPKDELKPYQWEYPILGKMGYKGFFDYRTLEKERRKLEKTNLEVCEGEVQAWSTLGILADPVLSSMLRLPNDLLARLIIHELTHTQVFISGDAELNENFATFIGTYGAKQFLIKKYGENSENVKNYILYFEDIKVITGFILTQRNELNALYQEHKTNEKRRSLKEKKRVFFEAYKKQLAQLKLHRSQAFSQFLHPDSLPKNCFFNDVGMYRNKQVQLKTELDLKFGGDLSEMVLDYKKAFGNEINPFLRE